jgi:hypothetical protein
VREKRRDETGGRDRAKAYVWKALNIILRNSTIILKEVIILWRVLNGGRNDKTEEGF